VITISLVIGIAIGSSEVIGVAERAGEPGTAGVVKTFFSSLAGVAVVFLFWIGLSHGKRTSEAPNDLSESKDGVGEPCLSYAGDHGRSEAGDHGRLLVTPNNGEDLP